MSPTPDFVVGACLSMYVECKGGQGSGAVGSAEHYIADFEKLLRREVGRQRVEDLSLAERTLFAQLLSEHGLYPPWRY